jgi:hypothetical protein
MAINGEIKLLLPGMHRKRGRGRRGGKRRGREEKQDERSSRLYH